MTHSLWQGVYPAATTQFAADFSLDLPACRRTLTALVDDGVDGLVLLGTVGENNSLRPKRSARRWSQQSSRSAGACRWSRACPSFPPIAPRSSRATRRGSA